MEQNEIKMEVPDAEIDRFLELVQSGRYEA